MANDYIVHRVDSSGASLDNFRFRPTVRFEVRHIAEDGVVAYRSSAYFADTGRSINGLRLGAAKACKNFQSYLDRTGDRWEVLQKAKADAARVAKKKADRLAWLEKNVPLLTSELAQLKEI